MAVAGLSLSDYAGAQEFEPIESDAAVMPAPLLGEAATSDLIAEAEPLSTVAPYTDEFGIGSSGVSPVRPVNWISGPYLRGGVNFVIGEGLFDAQQDVGYGISGGFRQPLGPEIGGDRFFFDLGGSFQDSYGRSQPKGTPGRRRTVTVGVLTEDAVVQDLYVNTLEEVRRGSVHTALGWFWGPGLDNRSWDTQLRFATRVGGRVGHARGGFTEELVATPINTALIQQTIEPAFFKASDTYGGVFVGTEAILLQRQYTFGQFQWTLDGEFANDWIDLGDGRWEGSLGTASLMMGFMLSR